MKTFEIKYEVSGWREQTFDVNIDIDEDMLGHKLFTEEIYIDGDNLIMGDKIIGTAQEQDECLEFSDFEVIDVTE